MLKKRLGIEVIEGDWLSDDEKLTNYFKIPPTLIIPEGCRKIGGCAFEGCVRLKEVVIPKSVKVIEFCAFRDCKSIEKIVIPGSVVKIGEQAFYCVKDVKKKIRN